MYNILGAIYFAAAAVMIGFIAYTTVRSIKTGNGFLTKKNLFYLAPTFVLLYLLHITASIYNGEDTDFFYCFTLIYTSLDVLKFRAVKTLLLPICKAFPIFYADFVLVFVMGAASVILSVASFFGRRLSNYISVRRLLRKSCDIVIGDSADAIAYIKRNGNSLLLAPNMAAQRFTELINKSIPVLRLPLESERVAKLKRGGYNIIVFRDGAFSYSKIIETFENMTDTARVKIYFEADQHEMKIIKDKFISRADSVDNLFLTGFNKYELMARRFVVEHPITKYIPRSFFNPNCTLKNDKKINVVFVGFGKVNYQLLRMCAAQFQFACEKNGKLAAKPVDYYIYDSNDAMLQNEFFSRVLYEADEEFSDCDFEKPEPICNVIPRKIDINSVAARKQFKALVTEDSFTYFIVSLDNDLSDASYVQTVMRILGNDGNYRVFVRARNDNGEKLNELGDRIIYFGEERTLYTHENIVNDDLTELAQRINLLYHKVSGSPEWLNSLKASVDLTSEQKGEKLRKYLADPGKKEFMRRSWIALRNIHQESNLHHALNLPFKLNLLGFDMVKREGGGVTEAQFNTRYVNSGRAKGYNDYAFYFGTESSNVLAFIEHSRWNALYILDDYTQMKKKDIAFKERTDDDGKPVTVLEHKDDDLKQHACITTYYGLSDLIVYKYGIMYPNDPLTEKNYKGNEKLNAIAKIYSYDYMDLDRIYAEIKAMGYVIVRNSEE